MDSPTGFDHDDFFGSYDAEQAHAGMSITPHEFDDASNQPPSKEQLAHWGRFRKPVGMVVAAMALLSVVALGKGRSRDEGSERPLVAHYGSALAAFPPSALSTSIDERATTEATSAPDAASDLLPEELSALVAEIWSSFDPQAPSIASTTVPLLVTDETDATQEPPLPAPEVVEFVNQADSNQTPASASAAPPICLLPAPGGDGAALDSSRVRGQAPEAWSLLPSMTWSTPSARP